MRYQDPDESSNNEVELTPLASELPIELAWHLHKILDEQVRLDRHAIRTISDTADKLMISLLKKEAEVLEKERLYKENYG